VKKIIFIFLTVLTLNVSAQNYGREIALTVMDMWKDSFSLNDKPAKWTYDMGVILKGIEGQWLQTGDKSYFQYIQKQIDFFINEDGSIKYPKTPKPQLIDYYNKYIKINEEYFNICISCINIKLR